MKTFVIGDIHGTYKALVQCLKRSGFDHSRDRLIVLGDVCDGYPDAKQCFDELLKVKNLDFILGNHDFWARGWATRGIKEDVWLTQGGDSTVASYGDGGMPPAHVELLKNAHPWLEWDNKLFVHGGLDPAKPLFEQSLETLIWDRNLINDAWKRFLRGEDRRYTRFAEIFLGHTPTQLFNFSEPLKACNIWDMDTGAGWAGKLTIMDTHTKEYWQSDSVQLLYPGAVPRRTVRQLGDRGQGSGDSW